MGPGASIREEWPGGAEGLGGRLRNGDESALAALLREEWSDVVGYAEGILAEPDAAEDVAQRAFVRLWRRRSRIDPDRSVRALLYRIARNLALDVDGTRRTRSRIRDGLPGSRGPATPEERFHQRQITGAIERAIAELSPRRREAFRLCRIHGLTQREAAEAMDLSPQTVANHVSAALRHVRTALAPHLG